MVKPKTSIGISQMRFLCNKNPTSDPAEVCLWFRTPKVKHTCTFSFPRRNFIWPKQRDRKLCKHPPASPRTTRCRERAFLFSVFSQLVWQPLFHKLASWTPTHAVLRTPPLQMKCLSPLRSRSLSEQLEGQQGVWGNFSAGSALLFKRWPFSLESNRPGKWHCAQVPSTPRAASFILDVFKA